MDNNYPLDDLIARFAHHQRAMGRAPGTILRYQYTFKLFGRFLEAEGLERTSFLPVTPW